VPEWAGPMLGPTPTLSFAFQLFSRCLRDTYKSVAEPDFRLSCCWAAAAMALSMGSMPWLCVVSRLIIFYPLCSGMLSGRPAAAHWKMNLVWYVMYCQT